MYLAATTIFRDEKEYMKEWLDFHILVGVQHFYLYDNKSVDNPKSVLQPYIDKGIVTYIFWDKNLKSSQRCANFSDVLLRSRDRCKWLAVISNDEFLYCPDGKKLQDNLKSFEQYAQIKVNWLSYGDNFLDTYQDKPVIERFTRRAPKNNFLNYTYKSIIQPNLIESAISSHEFKVKSGQKNLFDSSLSETSYLTTQQKIYLNQSETEIYGRNLFSDDILNKEIQLSRTFPNFNKFAINHYLIKSKQEFIDKSTKMKSLTSKVRGNLIIFQKFRNILNTEIDTYLKDTYLKLLQ